MKVQRSQGLRWRRLAAPACALLILAALVWPLANGAAAADGAYRIMVGRVDSSKFPDVRLSVTVIDQQYIPVKNLTDGKWELVEDGKPVKITGVTPVIDVENPITVVLGLDANASTDGRPLKDIKDAAQDFIFNLQPKDSVAVMSFGDRVNLVHRFSADKTSVAGRIRDMKAAGLSVLYDAVYDGLETISREPAGRKVLLFLSDGQDLGSRKSLGDVITRATELRVPVFTIGLGEDVNMDALRKISDASGGVALYAPTSSDVLGAYQTIANHLRSEYAITFRSNLKADAGRHMLTVRPILEGSKASDPVAFVATKNPPTIELLNPAVNAEMQDAQPIEVKITSQAEIARVEFSANGKVLATLAAPPWQFEWNTEDLKGGQHTLNVTVVDGAENRTTKFVPLVAKSRQEVVQAMRAPRAPSAATAGTGGFSIPPWLLMAIGAIPIAFVVLKVGRWGTDRYVPLRCSTHKITYPRGGVCPRCATDGNPSIDHRLRRFAAPEELESAASR